MRQELPTVHISPASKCEPDYTAKRTGAWSEHKTTRLTKGHEGKAIRISFLRELRVLCGSFEFRESRRGQVHSLLALTGSRMCGAAAFARGRLPCNSQWDRSSERLSKHTAFPTSLVCRDTEIGASSMPSTIRFPSCRSFR